MGLHCFAGRAFTSAGSIKKYTGRYLCETLLPGASAPVGLPVRRYSGDATRGPDVGSPFVCYPLTHRSIVKIEGRDTFPFLQGIITNDVGLLEEPGRAAMYSHMLNVQGRTLFDVMLYSLRKADSGPGVFLECDHTLKDRVLRHLKLYKIRRKVNISSCPELFVWAVLPKPGSSGQEAGKPELSSPEKVLVWENDPRTQQMGWRLVLDSLWDPRDVIMSCQKGDAEEYHRHRYAIGLPEGAEDLPPGVALPLESNLIYMQGVSFNKGCYIGQELTARTHHTGVIRRRLMPVRLSVPAQAVEAGASLQTHSGRPAGKHRAGIGELGLSLVHMAYAKEVLTVKTYDNASVTLQASLPDWWLENIKVN